MDYLLYYYEHYEATELNVLSRYSNLRVCLSFSLVYAYKLNLLLTHLNAYWSTGNKPNIFRLPTME